MHDTGLYGLYGSEGSIGLLGLFELRVVCTDTVRTIIGTGAAGTGTDSQKGTNFAFSGQRVTLQVLRNDQVLVADGGVRTLALLIVT